MPAADTANRGDGTPAPAWGASQVHRLRVLTVTDVTGKAYLATTGAHRSDESGATTPTPKS